MSASAVDQRFAEIIRMVLGHESASAAERVQALIEVGMDAVIEEMQSPRDTAVAAMSGD